MRVSEVQIQLIKPQAGLIAFASLVVDGKRLMASDTMPGEAYKGMNGFFLSLVYPTVEQAKKALDHCLANLNEGDRFDVVRFSTEAEPLFGELKAADKANVEKARAHVEKFKPTGGTAIDDALAAALKLRGGKHNEDNETNGRPFLIVFLTDGAPTIGITSEDEIVKRAVDRAADDVTPGAVPQGAEDAVVVEGEVHRYNRTVVSDATRPRP